VPPIFYIVVTFLSRHTESWNQTMLTFVPDLRSCQQSLASARIVRLHPQDGLPARDPTCSASRGRNRELAPFMHSVVRDDVRLLLVAEGHVVDQVERPRRGQRAAVHSLPA
jgi:hypothetical protein